MSIVKANKANSSYISKYWVLKYGIVYSYIAKINNNNIIAVLYNHGNFVYVLNNYRYTCIYTQLTIPDKDTTYWCSVFNLPEVVLSQERYIVKVKS